MNQKNVLLVKQSLPNLSLSLQQIIDITKDIKKRKRSEGEKAGKVERKSSLMNNRGSRRKNGKRDEKNDA